MSIIIRKIHRNYNKFLKKEKFIVHILNKIFQLIKFVFFLTTKKINLCDHQREYFCLLVLIKSFNYYIYTKKKVNKILICQNKIKNAICLFGSSIFVGLLIKLRFFFLLEV